MNKSIRRSTFSNQPCMGRLGIAVMVTLALSLAERGSTALAQSYSIDWYTIDGGGQMFSTSETYSLGGTIGQHDAGPAAGPMTGGGYSLTGGFWYPAGGGDTTPPTLLAAVSRKTHGSAGTFDIDVKAGAVEDRAGGVTSLIANFSENVQLVGGNPVTVSQGAATAAITGARQATVTITNANPAANNKLTVAFPGVANASDASKLCTDTLCVEQLVGDVNNDRAAVNILDLVSIRNQLNLAVISANFRCDVNADGAINILDLVTVRNVLSLNLIPCP